MGADNQAERDVKSQLSIKLISKKIVSGTPVVGLVELNLATRCPPSMIVVTVQGVETSQFRE